LLAQLHLQFLSPQTTFKHYLLRTSNGGNSQSFIQNPSILILDEPTASITQKKWMCCLLSSRFENKVLHHLYFAPAAGNICYCRPRECIEGWQSTSEQKT
jgi:hypothetical protein